MRDGQASPAARSPPVKDRAGFAMMLEPIEADGEVLARFVSADCGRDAAVEVRNLVWT